MFMSAKLKSLKCWTLILKIVILLHWCSVTLFGWWSSVNYNTPFPQFKIARQTNALHHCVKKFVEVNKPRFACVSLGKCRFWLISFDVPFCLKRNLEGNIVSWIAGTYPNFKRFYTSEVEKSKKPHFSKEMQAKTGLFTSLTKNGGEQKICAHKDFFNYGKGVLKLHTDKFGV